MPGTTELPPLFRSAKNLPSIPDPFVWAVEVSSPDDGPLVGPNGIRDEVLRLTSNSAPISWRVASDGTPLTWFPVRMDLGVIPVSADASIHPIEVRCSNTFGLAQLYLANNDDLVDHIIRLHIVSLAALNDATASVPHTGRITATAASLNSVSLVFAAPDLDFGVPKSLITTSCRWTYRKAGCDFSADNDGAILGPCARTIDACILRGLLEEALGLPKLHPKRFGGFLGLPRGGAPQL